MRGRKCRHTHTHIPKEATIAAPKSMLNSPNEASKSHNSAREREKAVESWRKRDRAKLWAKTWRKVARNVNLDPPATINQALIVMRVCECVCCCLHLYVGQTVRQISREWEWKRGREAVTRARLRPMHHAAKIFL